jgi:O-antigen/teichoic acid export membrane protein
VLLRDFVRHFCFAHLRPAGALGVDTAVAVIQLGGVALLAAFGLLSVGAVYAIMGVACVVAAAGWFLAKRRPLLQWRVDRIRHDWNMNWRFGRWALASYLVGSTTPHMLPWLIVATHGRAATGIWAACVTLVGMANMFVQGVTNYLTPRAAYAFTHGGVRELQRVLSIAAVLMLGVLGIFCFAVCLTGDWLVVIVYGAQYDGTGGIFLLLALTLIVTALGAVAGNGLWAIDRPSHNFAADLATIFATIGAAAALVVPWGVLGAAYAALLGNLCGFAVRLWTLSRSMRRTSTRGEVLPSKERRT